MARRDSELTKVDRLSPIDPRVGERRFMGRNAIRVDAMHAKSSITMTSTVRHGGKP